MRMDGGGYFVGAVPLSHFHSPVTECTRRCQLTLQPNGTQDVRLWEQKKKGSSQGHTRRWEAHAPRKPRVPKGFRKVFLKAK